jgi:hypothetical protein
MAAGLDAAHELLAQAVEQLATSEDWMKVLRMSKRMPTYSPGNCLLLAIQGAQGRVMGYQAWRKIPAQDGGHCQVARGAKSLKVLAPLTRSRVEVDEAKAEESRVTRLVGFRLVSVFDEAALVSPPDLPDPESLRSTVLDGDAPRLLWDALAAQIEAAGFSLDGASSTASGIGPANGLTDFQARMVWVRPDLPPAQRTKTLAHELAHVRLHRPDTRPANLTQAIGEVEAESVAFLVTRELGLDSSAYSIPYVTGWAQGDTALVLATADRSVKVAREITAVVQAFIDGPMTELPGDPGTGSLNADGGQTGVVDLPVMFDRPGPGSSTWADLPGSPGGVAAGEPVGEVDGEVRGELHQDSGEHSSDLSVVIGTPAGQWQIGWRPDRGSFIAEHVTADRTTGSVRVSRVIGALPQELASLGALEQRLGFALPYVVREQLTGEQLARPAALTGGRNFTDLYPGERTASANPNVSERPTPGSHLNIGGSGPPERHATYAAAMAARSPLRTWSQAGFTVEILAADRQLESEFADQQALTYRLSHDDRVVFSGDDILAPLHTDPVSDTAVRQVVVLLCQPDDVPLSAVQSEFVRTHAQTLDGLTRTPSPPYAAGTRIVVTSPGDARPAGLGTVVQATSDARGTVTSYSWRPDTVALPGHPWRDNPGHTLVSPADHVSATLAEVDAGLAGWTPANPLAYGARTAFRSDEGEPVEAVVERCYPMAEGWEYDLQPDLPDAEAVRVTGDELIPQAGTAWPTVRTLLEAREAAGLPLQDGEVLAVSGQLTQAVDGQDGITLVNRQADDLIRPGSVAASEQSKARGFDQQSLEAATAQEVPVIGCATPDCEAPARAMVTIGWPSGPAEISQRCQPCAARVAVASLARGCGVDIQPLEATDLELTSADLGGQEPLGLELIRPAPMAPPGVAL